MANGEFHGPLPNMGVLMCPVAFRVLVEHVRETTGVEPMRVPLGGVTIRAARIFPEPYLLRLEPIPFDYQGFEQKLAKPEPMFDLSAFCAPKNPQEAP